MFSRLARSLVNRKVVPRDLTSQQLLQCRHQATLSVSSCKKFLVVDEPKNQLNHSQFPLVWLRDNCQCRQCFHPEVNRRILDFSQFNCDQKISDYSVRIIART